MDVDVATRGWLKLILLPPGSLILILLIGWLFARHFFGRVLLLIGILSFWALSTSVGLSWLASQLETVPPLSPTQLKTSRADAIWVLLAGVSRLNPEFGGADRLTPASLERLDYGLWLHRKTGLPIVLSGGSVKGDTRPLAELGAEWLQHQAGVKPLAIDADSRDTWENAARSAALLHERNIERVLLITHAFHMPRALLSARAAGIDAVPAPFGYEHVPAELAPPIRLNDWVPQPGYLGRSYRILHEMLGLVWYGLVR